MGERRETLAVKNMIITTKYKICKRLGAGVFEKCQTQKFTLAKERAGARGGKGGKGGKGGRRGLSDYGKELLEKQKARYSYGLSERQFRNYVLAAVGARGVDSVKTLMGNLEGRLDNVVYRLGFAKTRRQARQLISHGHIKVCGRRVTVPSYATKQGNVISVRQESAESPLFAGESFASGTPPSWLSVDAAKKEGTVKSAPVVDTGELLFNPAIVLQFYNR